MNFDFWYENEKIAFADCCFYPNEGIYRGNVYNVDGKIIGDYSCPDSTEIEKRFPGIFGE